MSDEQAETVETVEQPPVYMEPDWMRRQWGDGETEGTACRTVYVQRAPGPVPRYWGER